MGDILSTSVRYEKMFEEDPTIQTALRGLYYEIFEFLQRIRRTLSKNCMFFLCLNWQGIRMTDQLSALRLVAEGFFRSVEMQFQDNARRLARAHEVFKEEATFAHRRRLQQHMIDLQFADSKLDRIVRQTHQLHSPEGKRFAQSLKRILEATNSFQHIANLLQ